MFPPLSAVATDEARLVVVVLSTDDRRRDFVAPPVRERPSAVTTFCHLTVGMVSWMREEKKNGHSSSEKHQSRPQVSRTQHKTH